MDIQVECHSGYTYPEYPVAVTIDGVRYEIKLVISDSQASNGIKRFTVMLENDQEITLKYNYMLDTWLLGSFGKIISPSED